MLCSSVLGRCFWSLIIMAGAVAFDRVEAQPAAPAPQIEAKAPIPDAPDATPTPTPGTRYRQTNLVSDWPGLAPTQDLLLVNPWGISLTASSPFWVSNNGSSTSSLYRGDVGSIIFARQPGMPFITILSGLPTGTVANSTNDFVLTSGSASGPARFIFATETGDIVGWNPNVPAAGSTVGTVAAHHPANVYKGLAIGVSGGNNYLYAADFKNGKIDVYDKTYAIVSLTGNFTDPTLPAGYAPFNIQNLGGTLYVAYALADPITYDEIAGSGNGYVSKFNTDGTFVGRLVSNGPLNAPWGMTIAPNSFGVFSGALLVGNFGDGTINAFSTTTGAFLGTINDASGNPLVVDGLWALTFGNGGAGGDTNTLYFSAGIGDEEHGLFGKITPISTFNTSIIQFSNTDYSVSEGTGHIDVTVTRTGNVSQPSTVDYATFDQSAAGHASQKSDYELALGTLLFNSGETSKTFRVLIVDDKFVEGDEVIDLYLTNPNGSDLGSPNHATVTLLDNDSVPPTTNPIDDTAFFVRQLYLDFLNREPDLAAFSFLTSQIITCGTNSACRDQRRVNAATALFLSAEFQQSGFIIYLANKAGFGSTIPGEGPAPLLYGQFERDLQIINQDVPFGQPGWESRLEAHQEDFLFDFVRRPAFAATLAALTPTQYVDRLYANAGVTPNPLEHQAAIDEFGGAGDSSNPGARARALRRVVRNGTFNKNEFNPAFVFFEYAGFYRRDPDTTGFNTLVAQLNSFNGDYRAAGAIKSFLDSSEYRSRFGNPALPTSSAGPTPTPGPQSLNISTRGRVGTGQNVLIAGFIINGSGSKKIVLRAIGPSLTSSGISDGLPDPVLELRAADGSLIESNDDWTSNQAAIQATGLAPTDPRESAIARTLAPGLYTAIVSGNGTATGVALAEVYDTDTQPSTTALANISTRGSVQTQNNVLIGGFHLGNTSGHSVVLARGIGPSLINFGVTTPLENPTLELHDSNGATIAANDDWRDTQELEILYFGIAPTDDLEAAIVAPQPPGPATVIVADRFGIAGIGLVEIFNFR